MQGELSHGLRRLATEGNRIVDTWTNRPVLLRGVNRSGLEYSEPNDAGFASSARITQEEIAFLVREWNCSILRIPFNQDLALRGRAGHSAESYLRDLDRVIAWASAAGTYTLLDLQWIQADRPYGPDRQFVPPLPDPETPQLWAMLARRYHEEPAALFDLFNEPHRRLDEDPHPLHSADGGTYPDWDRNVTMDEWQPWASLLIDIIRSEHPDALLFVSGTDWGYDLSGFSLTRPNLVYSTHVYPVHGNDWERAFGRIARTAPVFAAEWGLPKNEFDWGRELLAYFNQLKIGWCAWSWSDDPRLAHNHAATPYGELARQALLDREVGPARPRDG